ncbi:MAG: amidohydrolase family protein [Armatimonadetes bacterium]|nr:amidohydrolase family protein [Armatimonadota bacterium]
MTLVIKNGEVLLADGRMVVLDVQIEGGVIDGVGRDLDGDTLIDASGCYVLPGLVDLHTHGIGFEGLGTCKLPDYAALEASRGATAFFPTFFAPPDEIARQLIQYRAETDELRQVPQVAGFRLESPYLANIGGGVSSSLVPITPETSSMLQEAGGGHIRIWDISPELEGSADLIRSLTSRGILCSIAHTRASIEQLVEAVDAGARLVTHLFDTFEVPVMTDQGVYPAGLVDYLLVEDRVACEIIGDGTHVHRLLVEKALRCKTLDRTIFVTDSNLGAGLPPGEYDLSGGWGRAAVNGSNNGVRLVDRGMALAGSALTPIDAFRNVVRLFGRDMASASRLCSTTPSRLMGMNKGEIAVGRDADLIIVDADMELVRTIAAGRSVYTKAH